MADQSKESSMEEILSSIKRIIAEDKAIDIDSSSTKTARAIKPTLQAVPDVEDTDETLDDEILELTNEIDDTAAPVESDASGVFGDRRKDIKPERLINDQKLNSMRQSLSALVAMEGPGNPAPVKQTGETSLEDLAREMMRPMLKDWLDNNLPQLVEELVAREIRRISNK